MNFNTLYHAVAEMEKVYKINPNYKKKKSLFAFQTNTQNYKSAPSDRKDITMAPTKKTTQKTMKTSKKTSKETSEAPSSEEKMKIISAVGLPSNQWASCPQVPSYPSVDP